MQESQGVHGQAGDGRRNRAGGLTAERNERTGRHAPISPEDDPEGEPHANRRRAP